MVLTRDAEHPLAEFVEVNSPVERHPDRWNLDSLLTGAAACLTGWGTPPLSDALLLGLPDLKLVAHTAGSIRHLVPSAALRRGLKVSHAVAVIADAVAEMVVLQVLMHLRCLVSS
jgi:phosphoglycerate dehydrogenase-like enzyme